MIPDIAANLDVTVLAVMGENALTGFQRAYMIASATEQLREMLTPEYMNPIMKLQGSRLGFLTDKDKNADGTKGGGYPMEIVRECLIAAVLQGLQPSGNQFNIIAGNMYITKEGYHYLLSKIEGLKYSIPFELPRIKEGSAAVVALIKWSFNGGVENTEKMDLPIKVNKFMGADAVIGKATRKARHWLYSTITGQDTGDGDVQDTEATVISSTPTKTAEQHEVERVKLLLEKCKTADEVQKLQLACPEMDVKMFTDRIAEIGGHK